MSFVRPPPTMAAAAFAATAFAHLPAAIDGPAIGSSATDLADTGPRGAVRRPAGPIP